MKVTMLNGTAHCPRCDQPVRRYQTDVGETVLADDELETAVVSVGVQLRLTSVHLVHRCAEGEETA